MRAARVVTLAGPRSLVVEDIPDPQPASDQVVVDVHAAGVTYPDVLLSRGEYQMRPDPPFTPGSEISGVVVSAPADAPVAVGDQVMAFSILGGFAERAVVPAYAVWPVPQGLELTQAAVLPMNYLTCHFALLRRGSLTRGETVVIHGAAGGVGTAGIQIAKAWGARVIAVVSTAEKGEVARAAGADESVPVDGFLAAVKELTGGRGADIVLDPVGGDRFTDSLRCLAPEGRLLVIGFTGGEIPTVKVNRLLLNNTDVRGVGWGHFALSRPGYLADQWSDLQGALERGQLRPVVSETFPLERAAEAIAALDERRAKGNVVVTVR